MLLAAASGDFCSDCQNGKTCLFPSDTTYYFPCCSYAGTSHDLDKGLLSSTSSVLHELAFCPACRVILPLLDSLLQEHITTFLSFTLQDQGIRFGNLKPSKTGLSYEDLLGVPCLLILCEKGRMGDTFPHTFDCLDMRLRYAISCLHVEKQLPRIRPFT